MCVYKYRVKVHFIKETFLKKVQITLGFDDCLQVVIETALDYEYRIVFIQITMKNEILNFRIWYIHGGCKHYFCSLY